MTSVVTPPQSATPIVSFATVVRNGAPTLARAIQSVLETIDDRAEYIIVDGASSDGSQEIIERYADRLGPWLSEPDRGIYDAMNKAMDLASGDWLLFLGADDELLIPLDEALHHLRDAGTVYYGDIQIRKSGRRTGGRFNQYTLMQRNICHQSIFYPRSIYKRKKYDLDAGYLADYKYNIELWGEGQRFSYLDSVISRFETDGRSSGDQSYFDKTKMDLIRKSFGSTYHAAKVVRTQVVATARAIGLIR